MSASSRTKDFLVTKLLEMNQTVPLRKITTTSFSKYCGVNRGTFYYHFLDIQDLINYVFHSRVTVPLRQRIQEGFASNQELILVCLELMARDAHFYQDAFAIRGQNDMSSFFEEEVKENWHVIVDAYLESQYPGITRESPKFYYVSDCLASGHITMTELWVKGGMKESPAEMATLLELCSTKGLYASLDHIVESM